MIVTEPENGYRLATELGDPQVVLQWGQLKPLEVVIERGHHPPIRERVGALVNVYVIVGLPYFAVYNAHPHFCVHYTQDYYSYGMYSLCPCMFCILIFPSKLWAKACTLHMAKYSISWRGHRGNCRKGKDSACPLEPLLVCVVISTPSRQVATPTRPC